MYINILMLKLESNKIEPRDIPKIRGYIAAKYPQYLELHNHIGDKEYKYGYPFIQYKAIDNIPTLIAINDAGKMLLDVSYGLQEINIKDKMINIMEKGFSLKKEEFGCHNENLEYEFISPWMCLNQENYRKYLEIDEDNRNELLKRILIGNIISMAKAFSYTVENNIFARLSVKPLSVKFKDQEMIAFKGSFETNFKIPNFLGLGKSVARGFGCVKKQNNG